MWTKIRNRILSNEDKRKKLDENERVKLLQNKIDETKIYWKKCE